VPGANGQGKTRQECLEDLAAAVELMLEVNREQVMRQVAILP
jgi:predicted RNase H-like HicB family nuclease